MADDKAAEKSVGESTYQKRKFGSNIIFIFTCLAMSIGLGNLYRFPYVCYENGGGAFLIPYCTVTLLVGMPMYYLDIVVGQYSSRGPIRLYQSLARGWTGIGCSQTIVCVNVMSYYGHILAVCVYYFIKSFAFDLPWNECPPNFGNSCIPLSIVGGLANMSEGTRSSAEIFLAKTVLKESDDLESGLGYPDWEMCLCLAAVWGVAILYLLFGIKSSGLLSYFTAVFPFVILFVLLIRSSTLDGAWNGVIFFLKPDFSKLLSISVWVASVQQVFFNFGFGYGTIAMYASYNDIHRDMLLVSIILSISATLCSLLCGLCIFTAMGNLAHIMGTEVKNVVAGGGMTLAFITYPAAISHFPSVPYLFAITFFFMVFILGIGSLCSFQQSISTNMMEYLPTCKEWHASVVSGTMGFLAGIVYTTSGGGAIVTMVDIHGNVNVLSLLGLLQIIALVYVYGLQYLLWDVEYMTGKPVRLYLKWSWAVIVPITLILIYGTSFSNPYILKWKGKDMPLSAQICGLLLLNLVISPIWIFKIYYAYKLRGGGCKDTAKKLYSQEHWFPLQETEEADTFRKNKEEAYPVPTRSHIKKTLHALIKAY